MRLSRSIQSTLFLFLSAALSAQATPALILPLKGAELCENSVQQLADLHKYAEPEGRTFFGGREGYAKRHQAYLDEVAKLRSQRSYQLLEAEMGEARVTDLLLACAKGGVPWTKLSRILPTNLKGMSEYEKVVSQVRGFGKEAKVRKALEKAVVVADFKDLLAKNEVSEVTVETHYLVRVRYSTTSITLDPDQLLRDIAKTRYRTILVDETTYNSWKVGKVLDSSFNAFEYLFYDDGNFKISTAQVSAKYTLQQASMRLRSGQKDQLAHDELGELIPALQKSAIKPFESDLMGRKVYLLLNEEPRQSDFVQVAPLNRYFVKLQMRNFKPLSFSLRSTISDLADSVSFEYEVTREVYERNDAFAPTFNGLSFLLGNDLNFSTANIISRRTQPDPKYVAAKTADGTVLFLKSERYQGLRP